MNNLSWFIYLAQIITNLQPIFGMGGVIVIIYYVVRALSVNHYNDYHRDQKKYPNFFLYGALATVLFIICALFPTKETVYMIAASEAGETVVNSQEGKEILKDLREVLDAQLENLKKTD